MGTQDAKHCERYVHFLFLLKYPLFFFSIFSSRSVLTLPVQQLLLTMSLPPIPKLIRFFSVFSPYRKYSFQFLHNTCTRQAAVTTGSIVTSHFSCKDTSNSPAEIIHSSSTQGTFLPKGCPPAKKGSYSRAFGPDIYVWTPRK